MSASACPPCQDSPLSITANVISILTFVYILAVGFFWRLSVVKAGIKDRIALYTDLILDEANIRSLGRRANEVYAQDNITDPELQHARIAVILDWNTLRREKMAVHLLQKRLRNRPWEEATPWSSFFRRVRYLVWRDRIREANERKNAWAGRLEKQIERFE